MTVEELIAELQKQDPKAKVEIDDEGRILGKRIYHIQRDGGTVKIYCAD